MLIDLLRTRRSIRRFRDCRVEEEKVDLLIEAALRSPSSRNRQPWEIIVVTDPPLIAQLATAKPDGSALLQGAPLVIVVCATPDRSDVWVEDASIVTTLLHLEAHELGLGSCWVQIRLRRHDERQTAADHVADVLGLAPGITVEAMLAIGYPAENKDGHPQASLAYEKVSYRARGGG